MGAAIIGLGHLGSGLTPNGVGSDVEENPKRFFELVEGMPQMADGLEEFEVRLSELEDEVGRTEAELSPAIRELLWRMPVASTSHSWP